MEDPVLKLISLRWDVDSLVFLEEYKALYWLTACLDKEGKRIGITACCKNGDECSYHEKLKEKLNNQNVKIN